MGVIAQVAEAERQKRQERIDALEAIISWMQDVYHNTTGSARKPLSQAIDAARGALEEERAG